MPANVRIITYVFKTISLFLFLPLCGFSGTLAAYGDSITGCTGASSSQTCWTNQVGASLGMSLVNNGVGGDGLFDLTERFIYSAQGCAHSTLIVGQTESG